jgi:hypothetical protein
MYSKQRVALMKGTSPDVVALLVQNWSKIDTKIGVEKKNRPDQPELTQQSTQLRCKKNMIEL